MVMSEEEMSCRRSLRDPEGKASGFTSILRAWTIVSGLPPRSKASSWPAR